MSGYTKLFTSILASTIWREDDKTRIVWITLLAMADRHGVAEGSVPGLSDFARVSVADCRKALVRLETADEDSRSKEHGGRRILTVEGGWQIVNHGKYRAKLSADERREYLKVKQREYREKAKKSYTRRKQLSTNINTVSSPSTVLTHTDPAPEAQAVRTHTPPENWQTLGVTQADKVSDPIAFRASQFVQDVYPALMKELKGANYLGRPSLDWSAACELCGVWTDAELEAMARVFLTSTDPFITGGPLSIPAFKSRATWCETQLELLERAKRPVSDGCPHIPKCLAPGRQRCIDLQTIAAAKAHR